MIPDFQTIMLPLLKLLEDKKEHTLKDVVEKLSSYFQLSDEEKVEMIPSQRQATIYNRIMWANTYMKKAGLIHSPSRGVMIITDRGLHALSSNPSKINISFLKQFPEFVDFQSAKKDSKSNSTSPSAAEDADIEAQTPAEKIESAYSQLRKSLAQELLEIVIAQSPSFFEQLVVELLVKMGYGGSTEEAGKAIGKSGDEGIDGIIKEDKLGLDVIYIQAKRWQVGNSIGRPEIQRFVGALAGQGAKKGVFITTSSFTKEAMGYTPRNETKIVLIDGDKLAQLMIDYNIGVSPIISYEIKKVDLDYFES